MAFSVVSAGHLLYLINYEFSYEWRVERSIYTGKFLIVVLQVLIQAKNASYRSRSLPPLSPIVVVYHIVQPVKDQTEYLI